MQIHNFSVEFSDSLDSVTKILPSSVCCTVDTGLVPLLSGNIEKASHHDPMQLNSANGCKNLPFQTEGSSFSK